MAERQSDTVEKTVQDVLAVIQKYAPVEYQKLDRAKKDKIVQAARKTAEEEVLHAKKLRGLVEASAVEKELSKYLDEKRITMIKKGFAIPTYVLDISKRQDGYFWVDITREGKQFMPSRKLATVADIDTTNWLQYASILVEVVLLVMQAVNITVEVSNSVIARVAEETVTAIESSSQLQRALEALVEAWDHGTKLQIAKAIFNLIKDSNSAGILWKIIKGLCVNMSVWDWLKTATLVTALIIAAIATDGVALIAKIILALDSAYNLGKKIANLVQLSSIKETL